MTNQLELPYIVVTFLKDTKKVGRSSTFANHVTIVVLTDFQVLSRLAWAYQTHHQTHQTKTGPNFGYRWTQFWMEKWFNVCPHVLHLQGRGHLRILLWTSTPLKRFAGVCLYVRLRSDYGKHRDCKKGLQEIASALPRHLLSWVEWHHSALTDSERKKHTVTLKKRNSVARLNMKMRAANIDYIIPR